MKTFVLKTLWITLGVMGTAAAVLRSAETFIEYWVIWRVESLS